MSKIVYLAILESAEEGGYGVSFPDLPGCISYGKTFEEAVKMAREALDLHIYGMREDGIDIPEPSDLSAFSRKETEGKIVVPISADPEVFRYEAENRRVKTNCTIPKWLKKAAEEKELNFSRLLERAVRQELGLW